MFVPPSSFPLVDSIFERANGSITMAMAHAPFDRRRLLPWPWRNNYYGSVCFCCSAAVCTRYGAFVVLIVIYDQNGKAQSSSSLVVVVAVHHTPNFPSELKMCVCVLLLLQQSDKKKWNGMKEKRHL